MRSQASLALVGLLWTCACASSERGAPTAQQPAQEAHPPPATSAGGATAADRFHSPVAGVSIEKRPNWVFLPLEMDAENLEAVSVGKAETDEVMHKRPTPPLVVIARYPEPSEKPNPTLKITVRPLGELRSASAVEVARIVADGLKQAIPSFEVEGGVEATEVSGLAAGTFRAHFTISVPRSGLSFSVRSQAWVVPRGESVFIVAASDPSGGAEDYEADFRAMTATVVLRH